MDHHQVLEFSSEALTDFWLGWIKFEWKWVSFDKKDECHVLSLCVYCMSYHNLKGKSDIPFWCCLSNEFVKLVELIGLIKGMKIQSYYLSFLITSYNVCEFKENESQHKHKQKRCLNMMGCVFIKDLFVKHWYHFLKEVWFHKGDEWILKTECIEKNRMSWYNSFERKWQTFWK